LVTHALTQCLSNKIKAMCMNCIQIYFERQMLQIWSRFYNRMMAEMFSLLYYGRLYIVFRYAAVCCTWLRLFLDMLQCREFTGLKRTALVITITLYYFRFLRAVFTIIYSSAGIFISWTCLLEFQTIRIQIILIFDIV